MIYILFGLLVLFLFILLCLFKGNVLSPSVIFVSMFIISTLTALLNIENWGFSLNPITVFVITSVCVAFSFGEVIARMVYFKTYKKRQRGILPLQPIKLKKKPMIILGVCLIGLFFFYYSENIRMAKLAGWNGQNGLMFNYARQATLRPDIYGYMSRVAGYAKLISGVVAYIFSYYFFYDFIFFKKIRYSYLFLVATYFPYILFATGRTSIIFLICFWIVVGSCLYMQKKNWKPYYYYRIVFFGILGLFLFFLLFTLVGSLKSANIMENATYYISFYTGLSIPSLDEYLLRPRLPGGKFGEHTLFGVYHILRKFNLSKEYLYAPYDFVSFNGVKGNVYTMIRRYHEDFGYLGLYSLTVFLGFFYGFLFQKVKNKRGLSLILYGMIFYPVVMVAIEDQFFLSLFSHTTLYRIFLLTILYKFLPQNSQYNLNLFFKYHIVNDTLSNSKICKD